MLKTNKYTSYFPVSLFLFAALVWRSPYYVLSLYVAIPLLIIYCFYNFGKTILSSRYFFPYFFIVLWMILSSIANNDTAESLGMMVPIIASFLLAMSSYALTHSNGNSNILYFSYVILIFYLLASNILSGEFTMNFNYANEMERHSNSKLNANDYAYYSLFFIMGWRMCLQHKGGRNSSLLLIFLYLLSVGVSFFVALMTASRQVLILQIPLLIYFFYFDFIKGKGSNKLVGVLAVIAIVVASPMLADIYGNSYLSQRSEVGFQGDHRSVLMAKAIREGIDNPLFGLGLAAKTTFSHSTYTHLLSRSGILTFLLFVFIMVKSVIEQYCRFLRTRKICFLINLGCLGIIALGHLTYSYFNEPFMMSIMFAIIGSSDGEYKRIKYDRMYRTV